MSHFLIAIVSFAGGFLFFLLVERLKKRRKQWNQEERSRAYKALGNTQTIADMTADEDSTLGLNRLPHIAFTRQVWKNLPLSCDDSEWLDNTINSSSAPVASVYQRLLEAGFTKREITLIMRESLLGFLFNICYLLDDNMLDNLGDELKGVGWGIYETHLDRKGNRYPGQEIGCLHEFSRYFDLDAPDSASYLDETVVRRQQSRKET
ncbi:hypothetical protein K9N68_27980 [Kovacikia minuta CCNUW1]|uniref:hypothetical protein n=1 Tax=Kovacikia minuta TaxID=2931930 RepID=UPI001CCFAA9A|nr:hypothetical protein [Kovacikia minuta]UBF25397.1 hypothetical protein K9N68_27980 [Kovacikia minuta CCNUW1]